MSIMFFGLILWNPAHYGSAHVWWCDDDEFWCMMQFPKGLSAYKYVLNRNERWGKFVLIIIFRDVEFDRYLNKSSSSLLYSLKTN